MISVSRYNKGGKPPKSEPNSADIARERIASGICAYPYCKCIVSTSTTNPVPHCQLGLYDGLAGYSGAKKRKRNKWLQK